MAGVFAGATSPAGCGLVPTGEWGGTADADSSGAVDVDVEGGIATTGLAVPGGLVDGSSDDGAEGECDGGEALAP